MGKSQIVRNLVVLCVFNNTKKGLEFIEMPWDGKGQATAQNLEKFVLAWNQSVKPGGCNAHLSESKGFCPFPNSAFIKSQITKKIVARWQAPKFMEV